MTDSNGVVRWAADYKPFGEATIDQAVTTITNNLRFPGQYFDYETGLHYNYFRDYNPAVGKYPQADPIGLLGGINPYNYVSSNPVNSSDPLGLLPKWIVPQYIVNNSQMVVNVVTNNAFDKQQLATLTDLVIANIGLSDALKFAKVGFDPQGNVPLTKDQKKVLDDLFQELLKDKENQDLINKAFEEYQKAFKEKKCYLK
jgi:RHS repeat-associated protein